MKLRRHKFLGTCTVAGCEGTVYAYRDKGNLYDHLHERHPGIAEEYLSGGYAMRSPIRFYMQLLPLDRLGDEPKEPTDQANEVNPNCEGTEVVEDRVRAVDKQFFKSKHVHEEMKLYSTEIPPHSERRLAPPRDSLEPTSFGTPRGSNKMIWNPTRHTDELVERNPLRHTDELIETRAFDTSSLEPQLTSVEIKAESERLRRS